MQEDELLALLKMYAIPVAQWGVGDAKTLQHLLEELNAGEVSLQERQGMLVRTVAGSSLNVYYKDGATTLMLTEKEQIFTDGRHRKRNIETSIGEKMKRDETPGEAAWRAMREELNIEEQLPLIPRPKIIKGPIPSESFPGLYTLYTIHVYDVFLPKRHFKPEGYTEHQTDKTTVFVWREI